MRGNHDPAGGERRIKSQAGTVVEGAHHPTFWVGQVLIGRQFEASLDFGSLQDLIVFAAYHIGQSCQIGKNGPCAIWRIEAQQNTFFRVVMDLSVAVYGREGPTQFWPVFPIAGVSKRAEK